MVKIDERPETPLSAIKFFVSMNRAVHAINELAPHLEASVHWLETGVWISWYVKVAHRGYLRESGEVY